MPPYWSPGEPSIFAPNLREKYGSFRLDTPTPFSKGFKGAAEVEHFEPLYPGDRLRGTAKLVEINPRRTRLGDGVFLTSETRLTKQTGELVSTQRNTGYRYNPHPKGPDARKSAAQEQGTHNELGS